MSGGSVEDNANGREEAAIPDDRDIGRPLALSDGVFAIAITLLTFQLQVTQPLANSKSWSELASAISDIEPKLESYTITFLVLGAYWMAHHRLFRGIMSYDRPLLLLNLLYLLGVGFTPFPASLVGTYPRQPARRRDLRGQSGLAQRLLGDHRAARPISGSVRQTAVGVPEGAVAGVVLSHDLITVHAGRHSQRPLGAVLLAPALACAVLRDPEGCRDPARVTRGCPGRDSNPHALFGQRGLSPPCLPVTPPGPCSANVHGGMVAGVAPRPGRSPAGARREPR